jgi:hypothetical protein
MTSLLTTMRQRLADAENDAERLRAAIQILEQAETAPSAPRKAPRRRKPAAAAALPQAASAEPAAAAPSAAAAEPAAAKPAAAVAKPAAVAAKPRRATRVQKKTAAVVVPLEKLLKVVGENPGTTTTALVNQTGGDRSALLELLKESEQKGEVRREGDRRTTSWHLITDEDRIAVRAAELAAQSKRAGTKAPRRATKPKVAV